MNRRDKLLNIRNANILAEQRYLQEKGLLDEDLRSKALGLGAGIMSLMPGKGQAQDIKSTEKQHTPTTISHNQVNKGPEVKKMAPSNELSITKLKSGSQEFGSGSSNINSPEVESAINDIKNFMAKNPDRTVIIRITASQSKVRSVANVSDARAKAMKSFILSKISSDKISFAKPVLLEPQGPEWNKDTDNKEDPKYKEFQYVIFEAFDNGGSVCNIKALSKDGGMADESTGFVSNRIPINNSGSFEMEPGSIPDRLQTSEGQDTGYFADKLDANDRIVSNIYRLDPKHVADLTRQYSTKGNSSLDAFKGLENDLHTFDQPKGAPMDALIKYIVNEQYLKNFNMNNITNETLKSTKGDVTYKEGLEELAKLWNAGIRTFLFYKVTGKQTYNIHGTSENATLITTYSPLGSTGFNLNGQCK